MNDDIIYLLSHYECHIYEAYNGDDYRMSLFIPYQDIEDLITDEFRQYLLHHDEGLLVAMVDGYIVVDLVHYIVDWLGEDIRNYLGYADNIDFSI